jgi:hypothetical protein
MAYMLPERFWLITEERGSLDDFAYTATIVIHGEARDHEGRMSPYVVAFSDERLAAAFLEDRREEGLTFYSFCYPDPCSFIELARHLKGRGFDWIGFDPTKRPDRLEINVVPLDAVVAALEAPRVQKATTQTPGPDDPDDEPPCRSSVA